MFDYPSIAALTSFVLSLRPLAGTSATAVASEPQLMSSSGNDIPPASNCTLSQVTIAGRDGVIGQVQSIFAEVLGSGIGQDQPFSAAGLDSLAAVESRNTLNRSAITS